MSKAGKITAAISGAFLLLIVVAIILIATFDWNRLKPTINQKVSAELNRPFAIRGDLGVVWERQKQETGWRSWVPWPHVHAEDIILGNPPDIPEVTMVHLPRVEATLAPLALLTNSHFAELLDMLARMADYVIVDAPPVGVVIDAAEIAKACDGTLIAVHYNDVSRQELLDVKQQIEQTGCPILGTVLNQVDYDNYMGRKYYKSYSKYGKYGYYRKYYKRSHEAEKK